ncbi:MAG: hypothetical protein QM539_09780 [Alphaproteobacteria bacterium]|nr:hypothetical protein [Alphaproteobacteria bacterium]
MQIEASFFTTHKQNDLPETNADKFAFDSTETTATVALADGVTQSFHPQIWAEILTQHFVHNPTMEFEKSLAICQKRWFETVEPLVKAKNNYYINKIWQKKTPAAATFVGLHLFYNHHQQWTARYFINGDSFLIYIPTDKTKPSQIFSSIEPPYHLDNFPPYLASLGQSKLQTKQGTFLLDSGYLLLLTDACAEWYLNNPEPAFDIINSWSSPDHFLHNLQQLRTQGNIKDDDTTIIKIKLSQLNHPALHVVKNN